STVSFTSDRSAETICSCIRVGIAIAPLCRFALLELRDHFVDRAGHVEILLRDLVVLAFDDLLEAADRVRNLHVLPLDAGELLRDEERLRQELLQRSEEHTSE